MDIRNQRPKELWQLLISHSALEFGKSNDFYKECWLLRKPKKGLRVLAQSYDTGAF